MRLIAFSSACTFYVEMLCFFMNNSTSRSSTQQNGTENMDEYKKLMTSRYNNFLHVVPTFGYSFSQKVLLFLYLFVGNLVLMQTYYLLLEMNLLLQIVSINISPQFEFETRFQLWNET